MQAAPVDQVFETLSDAIIHAFRQEQTSLLSLDKICEIIQSPNIFLNAKKDGVVPGSTIIRRRISSTLSSSVLFVRAGPPRACLWAIRPNNPLFLSDGVISSSIEQMLTNTGPMTLEQFAQTTQLNGADIPLFERFLTEHSSEFVRHPDNTYWFTGQPRPIQRDFESISHALVFALSLFPEGASVEELTWYLCLSTVNTFKTITRRNVSRELSRRTDLFDHLARARYTLSANRSVENRQAASEKNRQFEIAPLPTPAAVYPFFAPLPQSPPPQQPQETILHLHQQPSTGGEDEDFDPFSFFGHDFHFAFE
jgi:hypothetical protein